MAFCLETPGSGAHTESRTQGRAGSKWPGGDAAQTAERSARPPACNLGPARLLPKLNLLPAVFAPQNLRFSLKMETRGVGIGLASRPGSGGHEGQPESLRAPGAAFEAEIQSIFEDSCSVCGKVGKMLKIQ